MKNINEILATIGVEIPEDKKEEFNKVFNENYKTTAEFDKKVGKLEADNKGLADQLKTATDALEGFKDVDVEGLKDQVAKAQKDLEDAQNKHKAELESRDFEDALKAEMEQYNFSSRAAKEAVIKQVKDAGLKIVDGKILGLGDLMASIKESDADAFKEDEGGNPPAKFTGPKASANHTMTKDEILAIENRAERQAMINDHLDLFV